MKLSALVRFCIVAILAAASGCGEEPRRLAAAEAPGYSGDDWRDQLRSRTRLQHESERIYP